MEYSNTSILWRVIVLILVVIGWYFLYHKTTALPVQKVTVERLSKTYWINQPILPYLQVLLPIIKIKLG